MGLGGLAIFNVRDSMSGLLSDLDTGSKQRDDEMYNNIRNHKRSVRPVSTTLNLTGIAMVAAALILQFRPIQQHVEAKAADHPNNAQGPFTLFHAYTLLSLLWLITLTGLMIHVHTWVRAELFSYL
jgi:hypothetical protein